MAEDTFLPDDLLRQLMSVGEVDLLVGVVCHNAPEKLGEAVQAIERSFQQFFVRQRVVIVNIDGGDKQPQHDDPSVSPVSNAPQAQSAQTSVPRHGITSLRTINHVNATFSVTPSSGAALRILLASADLLRARGCAIVSPATCNLTPESIAHLLRPAFQDKFDFVAPLYSRHKFQGLLARNLVYPMCRALFGAAIRELYTDEWGFSGRLASSCLSQDIWHEEAIQARPEAWMALSALSTNYRFCQTFLGEKPPARRGPATDIVEVLRQTVGTLFWCLETRPSAWLDGEPSPSLTTIGPDHELTIEPSDLDPHRIFEMFRTGVTELEPVLVSILDPETHSEIKNLVAIEEGKFRFKPDLWVRTLYDFAASYHHSVINRGHLVQALAPLYRGMTHSFLLEHSDSSPAEMEAASEMLCSEFELQKPYLRERWKTKVEVAS